MTEARMTKEEFLESRKAAGRVIGKVDVPFRDVTGLDIDHHQPNEDTMTDNTLTDNNIKPTKPVDHRIHIAALRGAEAAYYDGLAAEAERRGHFRMSIKHRETAAELRRLSEADARSTGQEQ